MLAIFQTLLIRACSMISALAIPSQSDKRQKCVTFCVFFLSTKLKTKCYSYTKHHFYQLVNTKQLLTTYFYIQSFMKSEY